ncbi:glycosyltransferase [Microbacterium marinum]|uniref:glycosyltransferase n=1 Tax=Microbacterium marinum TaxID=421115 RepID=UPI00384E43CE
MTEVDRVIFIEPFPFASRLHVLGPLAQGAAATAKSEVLIPGRETGVDWDEFIEAIPSDVSVIRQPGLTVRRESGVPPRTALAIVKEALKRTNDRSAIVLTAIDDYPKDLWRIAFRLAFRKERKLFIRYRVDDFRAVSPRRGPRQWAKRIYFGLCTLVARAETVVFDERIRSGRRVHVVPDPWTGPFGFLNKSSSREALGWPGTDRVVTIVGNQDPRKGFSAACEILALARQQDPELRAVLVGKVPEIHASELAELSGRFGSAFTHVARYVTDNELALLMSGSDAILMPYTSSFTSTSGVLVRAAASNTPVISTGHGLVGWRVTNHHLGATFAEGKHADAASLILKACTGGLDSEGRVFADASTAESLSKAFASVLTNRHNVHA